MAYSNVFPVGYQPYYQQYQNYVQPSPAPMPAQQNNSSIIWVQGEAGAKSYLVAPNTTVQLWDSEDQVIYLKSADASGMPSMKVLDYKIRGQSVPPAMAQMTASAPSQDYVTREELAQFEAKIHEQFEAMQAQANAKVTRARKEKEREVEDNG